MNIGICCYPSYGGSGVVATELGIQLAAQGHQIHFIAQHKPFRLGHYHPNIYFHEVESPNYPVFIHPPYLMAMANTIKAVDDYCKLDILHAHYAVPHAMATWLGRQMIGREIPLVTTLHGTDVTILGDESTIKDAVLFSILNSTVITAVSDSLKHEAEVLLGHQREIKRIYNFVDMESINVERCPDIKQRLGIKEYEKVIVHVSNFRPVKRILDLIEAFKCIVESVDAKLMLIGEGPELCQARCKVKEYQLEEQVLFLGKQTGVMELLSIGDLFALPSEKESFGLAALEAMACGIPVVATRAGGLPEVIESNETGILCDIGDVKGLVEALELLLTDDVKRKQMGMKAVERAKTFFDTKHIIPQYIELYQSLLNGE